MMDKVDIALGKAETSVAEIAAIARGACIGLDPAALDDMRRIQGLVATAMESGQAIYGLTTGVGDLYSVRLRPEEIAHAQMNILRSHASGVGAPHDQHAIRAIMA